MVCCRTKPSYVTHDCASTMGEKCKTTPTLLPGHTGAFHTYSLMLLQSTDIILFSFSITPIIWPSDLDSLLSKCHGHHCNYSSRRFITFLPLSLLSLLDKNQTLAELNMIAFYMFATGAKYVWKIFQIGLNIFTLNSNHKPQIIKPQCPAV